MLFYAGNTLTGKALAELSPFTIAFFRFAIALLVLLPLGWRDAWNTRTVFRQRPVPVVLMAVSGVVLFNTLIYASLRFTSATNVAVLQTAAPALTAFLGVLLVHESLNRRQWTGILLSVLGGAWVITDGPLATGVLGSKWNLGDGLAVAALVSWSCYTIAVRRFGHYYTGHSLLLVMTSFSVVLVFPFALRDWMIGGFPVHDMGGQWLGLAYLGVFPSVVALAMYNRAVGALGAARASAFLGLLPVFTVLGAYLFLEDRVGATFAVGTALVVGGLLLTTLGGRDDNRGTFVAGSRR
jgi:drug/metabolite transporter (DMT)-like permease